MLLQKRLRRHDTLEHVGQQAGELRLCRHRLNEVDIAVKDPQVRYALGDQVLGDGQVGRVTNAEEHGEDLVVLHQLLHHLHCHRRVVLVISGYYFQLAAVNAAGLVYAPNERLKRLPPDRLVGRERGTRHARPATQLDGVLGYAGSVLVGGTCLPDREAIVQLENPLEPTNRSGIARDPGCPRTQSRRRRCRLRRHGSRRRHGVGFFISLIPAGNGQ